MRRRRRRQMGSVEGSEGDEVEFGAQGRKANVIL